MKRAAILFLIGFTVIFTACGGSKDAEVKAYLDDVLKVFEEYADDIEKVDSGKKYADAVEKYMDGLIDISKKGKELQDKYPDVDENADYMKDYEKKMETVSQRIYKAQKKSLMKYMMDPQVARAMQNMQKKMSQVDMPFQPKK